MDNLQTNKKYYIPMEVTNATIKDFGINSADVEWTRIGHRRVRVIMVPATEEQYSAYMRPLWREDRRQQRHPMSSLDNMYEESAYELADTYDLEADVMKQSLLEELHAALDELEEIDHTIMEMYANKQSETKIGKAISMSQKGVNKRKHKIFLKLRARLQNYK